MEKRIYSSLVCAFLALCLTQTGLSQQQGEPSANAIYVEIDGVMTRLVPDGEETADAIHRMKNATALHRLRQSGSVDILTGMSIGDLSLLSGLELSPLQRKELETVFGEYETKFDKIRPYDKDSLTALNVRYARKIQEILLPEQLEELAKKTNPKKRLLSLLVYSSYGKQLGITKAQRDQLVQRSKRANAKIDKSIAEIERIKKDCQAEIFSIYENVLSEKQKAMLANRLDAKKFIEAMSFSEMEADTNMDSMGRE